MAEPVRACSMGFDKLSLSGGEAAAGRDREKRSKANGYAKTMIAEDSALRFAC